MRSKLTGILFLAVALAIVLSQLKVFPNLPIMLIVLTLLFGYGLLKAVVERHLFSGVFNAFALFIIYNHEYKFAPIDLWTSVLIGLLVYMGLSQFIKPKVYSKWESGKKFVYKLSNNDSVMFGEKIKYLDDPMKNEYAFDCTFGSMKIYFNNPYMNSDTIYLRANVQFGEMMIFVPSQWRVENHISAFLGEVNSQRDVSPKQKTLILTGNVTFGEMQVIYI